MAEFMVAERLGWFGGGKMLVVWEWWQGVRLLYCLKL